MTFPRRFSQLTVPVAVGAVVLGALAAPRAARAQDRAAVEKVTQLNKKAVEAYENLDFEDARKLLKQALDLCATSGMEQHKLKARTHVHLGIVFVGGMKQREIGIKQFRKALDIQPDISLTRALVNPDIQSAFDEAKSGGGGGGAETAGTAAPPPPPPEPTGPRELPPENVQGLYHDLVNDGVRGQAVEVRAAVGKDVEFDKVMLAYRPKGANDYLAREMTMNEKGWYAAEIPAAATAADLVAYYIEVRNKGGQPVLANGSAREPNLVALSEAKVAKHKKKQAVDEESEEGGEEATAGDEEEAKPKKHKKKSEDDEEGDGGHSIFLAFGLGSGAGWTQGKPELNPKDVNKQDILIQPGVAPAQLLHLAPEIGFYLAPDFVLSVQGRIQIVKGTTKVEAFDDPSCGKGLATCPPAGGALAVFAKATWLFGEETKVHPYFNLSVGGGSVRHLVNLAPASVPGCNVPIDPMTGKPKEQEPTGECKDTVRGGVFLAGPGGGFFYDLSPSTAFVAGANAQVGVPDFTINVDLNVGLAISL